MTGIVPDWLTRVPIAHRGLHGGELHENTLSACEAAIEQGFAIEVDLRLTADGGLVVIHDATLDRTTTGTGPVIDHTLDDLRQTPIAGADETLSSLDDLFALVSGRAALFLEAKAPRGPERQAAMASAIARAMGRYSGAATVMTFEPDLLALLRTALPDTPLGVVAGGEGRGPSLVTRFGRDAVLHAPRTKPDFVAYYGTALPHPAVAFHRRKRPVLTWTIRSQAEADRVAPHVDQIIFEGFVPGGAPGSR